MQMGLNEFLVFYSAYKNDNSQARVLTDIDRKIPEKILDMIHHVTYQGYTAQLNPEWDALCEEVNRLSENVHMRIGDFVITVWTDGVVYTELLQDRERRDRRMTMGENDEFYREDTSFMPVSWDSRILVSSTGEVLPRGEPGETYIQLLKSGRVDDAVMMMIDICKRETNDWRRANGG